MKRGANTHIMRHFIGGLLSVLKTVAMPLLYRYPYRTSAEGFRADWSRIGQDIESVIGRLKMETRHERRNKK